MNKNFENYKNTFSQIRPSDKSIERVMNMTQKREHKFSINFKRLAAAALAFALMIGGGFGTNYAIQKNNSDKELGVLVAYASSGDYFEIGSQNEQDLFTALYVAPVDDEKEMEEAKDRYYADWDKVKSEIEKLAKKGYSTHLSGDLGPFECESSSGEVTAKYWLIQTGNLALSLDDYSDVKAFKVENSSKYLYLKIDYLALQERLIELGDGDHDEFTDKEAMALYGIAHKINITGDELRESQDSGQFSGGTKHEVNKGYFLEYYLLSDELEKAIGNDPNFDLTQIKDTITFTVEFNDGSVKNATVNMSFDSDGYMHFAL